MQETILVPARKISDFYVRIKNSEQKQGFIPQLHLCNGVYLGNAVVSNNNNKAYMKIFNTNITPQKLTISTVELIDFEELPINEEKQNNTKTNLGDRKEFNFSQQIFNDFINQIPKINDYDQSFSISNKKRENSIKELLRLDHLNQEEKQHVENLIQKYADRFHIPGEPLGATTVLQHNIPTTDDQPIFSKQYRFPLVNKEVISRQVNELINNKIIKPSQAPYNTPVWIVPKKLDSHGNKKWRMVLDFRKLNENTIGDSYLLPNIIDISDQLGSAQYFSVFDLASGFHQIKMSPKDSHETAFSTPYGHYEFDRMPFGLKNAPGTFQRLMDLVLTGLQGTKLFVYQDNIVLYANSLEELEEKFKKLMERLSAANLKLQSDKCEYLRPEVAYSGHIIDKEGVRPDPKKREAVKSFQTPKNPKNIKQFLGLAGYYRRFIDGFSKIATPLNQLLMKDGKFNWSEKQ